MPCRDLQPNLKVLLGGMVFFSAGGTETKCWSVLPRTSMFTMTMKYDVVEKDRDYFLRMKNPYYGTVEADSIEEALRIARERYGAKSLTGLRLIPLPPPSSALIT